MITINVITENEVKYLTGKIGKTAYSVEFSEEAKEALKGYNEAIAECATRAEADTVLEQALAFTSKLTEAERNSSSGLVSLLGNDLVHDKKKNEYYLVVNGNISERPVHKFFADKMIEAGEKGVSPKPWLMFWVRLMRNPLYRDNSSKVERIIKYLKATYVDTEAVKAKVEEGYSHDIATKLCTFDQVSITEQGILAAFKYVALAEDKYEVEKKEDGTQEIVRKNRYERLLEVDDVTGEITKDELQLPEEAEDFVFLPPVQGTSGDEFTCAPLDVAYEDAPKGHIIKVGNVHELAKGFSQVNTDDNSYCVKGLHLGGYYYVENYGGATKFLVDCLVSPEDIGAVADMSSPNTEGAIRCRRYMVVGAHFQVSRGMYHPAKYGKLLDAEWAAMKAELIEQLKSKQDDILAID
jgi:hypothetical protein